MFLLLGRELNNALVFLPKRRDKLVNPSKQNENIQL